MVDNIKGMKKDVLKFFKSAFCVDGEVRLVSAKDFKVDTLVIELNDSKRGTFYIAQMRKVR